MAERVSESKTPKSELTKKRIIDTFLELICTKKWDKIPVKELCSHADITRGTFYQYFNDIYDLMEHIQTFLLDDITRRYDRIPGTPPAAYPLTMFDQKFDYSPPEQLSCWFAFCKRHKKAMTALLDPHYGDTYFVKKLKNILTKQINIMMDGDSMPNDEMRTHFIRIFTELHFLAARSWLDSGAKGFLPTKDIVHLLNGLRVGENYLTYKAHTAPDYKLRMNIPEEEEV